MRSLSASILHYCVALDRPGEDIFWRQAVAWVQSLYLIGGFEGKSIIITNREHDTSELPPGVNVERIDFESWDGRRVCSAQRVRFWHRDLVAQHITPEVTHVFYADTDCLARGHLEPLWRWAMEGHETPPHIVVTQQKGDNMWRTKFSGGYLTEEDLVRGADQHRGIQSGTFLVRAPVYSSVMAAWEEIDGGPVRDGYQRCDQASLNKLVFGCYTGRWPWRVHHWPLDLIAFPDEKQYRLLGSYRVTHAPLWHLWPRRDQERRWQEQRDYLAHYRSRRQAVARGGTYDGPFAGSEKRYLHSGARGDLLAGLCAMKALGGGILHCRGYHYRKRGIDAQWFESLERFLRLQPYIKDLVREDGEETKGIHVNLDSFRLVVDTFPRTQADQGNLADLHLWAQGLPSRLRDVPWLTLPPPRREGRVVFSRTERCPGGLDWRRAREIAGEDAVFIGTPQEHVIFEALTGQKIRRAETADLYDVASVIAGGDVLVTNQTAAFWLAEGAKRRVVQEVCVACPDCLFERPGFAAIWPDARAALAAHAPESLQCFNEDLERLLAETVSWTDSFGECGKIC